MAMAAGGRCGATLGYGYDGRSRLAELLWMRRMTSARKNASTRGSSTKARESVATRRFAVCIRNEGYEASLERNKIYAVLPDAEAERDGDLRVIDESGEDYLFSADRFVA